MGLCNTSTLRNVRKFFKKSQASEKITESKILELNDYCLEEINKYLDINDRINLSKTCVRMKSHFESREKFDVIDLDLNVFKDERKLRNVLDMFAPSIEKIITSNKEWMFHLSADTLELVIEACKNLTTIEIYGKMLKQEHLALISNVEKLKSLSLKGCPLDNNVRLRPLANLQNLESLDVSATGFGTVEEDILEIKNLKKLQLNGWLSENSKILEKFLIQNPQLTVLDMKYCPSLNAAPLNAVIANCKQIETLKVNGDFVNDKMLMKFECLKSLSELDLSHGSSFSEQGLLTLLKKLPHLKLLIIKSCKQIEKRFLIEALELLKNQNERTEPFECITTIPKTFDIPVGIPGKPHVFIKFE